MFLKYRDVEIFKSLEIVLDWFLIRVIRLFKKEISLFNNYDDV